jgi:hypothetical protein
MVSTYHNPAPAQDRCERVTGVLAAGCSKAYHPGGRPRFVGPPDSPEPETIGSRAGNRTGCPVDRSRVWYLVTAKRTETGRGAMALGPMTAVSGGDARRPRPRLPQDLVQILHGLVAAPGAVGVAGQGPLAVGAFHLGSGAAGTETQVSEGVRGDRAFRPVRGAGACVPCGRVPVPPVVARWPRWPPTRPLLVERRKAENGSPLGRFTT